MKENEKFEKFVAKLREYVDKVNKASLAERNDKRIWLVETDELIDNLEYYLEHQEKIKETLQDVLNAYKELYEIGIENSEGLIEEEEEIGSYYGTYYFGGEVIQDILNVGKNRDTICYTYDGSTLTFGIWHLITGLQATELVRIAINTRLQFKDEEELKDLVEKAGRSLMYW